MRGRKKRGADVIPPGDEERRRTNRMCPGAHTLSVETCRRVDSSPRSEPQYHSSAEPAGAHEPNKGATTHTEECKAAMDEKASYSIRKPTRRRSQGETNRTDDTETTRSNLNIRVRLIHPPRRDRNTLNTLTRVYVLLLVCDMFPARRAPHPQTPYLD